MEKKKGKSLHEDFIVSSKRKKENVAEEKVQVKKQRREERTRETINEVLRQLIEEEPKEEDHQEQNKEEINEALRQQKEEMPKEKDQQGREEEEKTGTFFIDLEIEQPSSQFRIRELKKDTGPQVFRRRIRLQQKKAGTSEQNVATKHPEAEGGEGPNQGLKPNRLEEDLRSTVVTISIKKGSKWKEAVVKPPKDRTIHNRMLQTARELKGEKSSEFEEIGLESSFQ